MNNMTVINTFKGNNSNIVYIKAQHHQIMTTIAYRILKFEPMKPLLLFLATSILLLKSILS